MDNFSIYLGIPTDLSLICFTLVILINLLLIKPILKKDKSSSPVRIVSMYLLIGNIVTCCYIGLIFLSYLDYYDDSEIFYYLLYLFSFIPSELSAFNLLVYSFIVLKNNHFFVKEKSDYINIYLHYLVTFCAFCCSYKLL